VDAQSCDEGTIKTDESGAESRSALSCNPKSPGRLLWIVVWGFLAGAFLAGAATWLLLRPPFSLARALPCETLPTEVFNVSGLVFPTGIFNISGFKIKILDYDAQSPKPRKGETARPQMANLQWCCDIENTLSGACGYHMKVEMLDNDGFVLAIGGSAWGDDLTSGQTKTIHSDIVLDYSKAKRIASARITPMVLKTNAEIQQERADAERQRKEAINEQRAREAKERMERKANADRTRVKWMQLREGMSEYQVERILGKPSSVDSFGSLGYSWYYPPIELEYRLSITPEVRFSESRVVRGWSSP